MEALTEVECFKHPDAGVTPKEVQRVISTYIQEVTREAITTQDLLCSKCSEKWLRQRANAEKMQALRLREGVK